MRTSLVWGIVAVAAAAAASSGCGGGGSKGASAARVSPGGSKDPSKWPADDRTMCEWRGKADVDVAESAGPGALKPNVRRVYKMLGSGDSVHKTLVCREIDSNLDGIKDVARLFNEKGQPLHELADTDYDGKLDVWTDFVDGRVGEEKVDTNNDGKPDVWKFYTEGRIQRVRRDRNFDGKPDTWEIYANGRLERVGVDLTFDGHVDRWDRDEQLRYETERAEKAARDALDGDAGASKAPGDAGALPARDGG